MLPPYQQETTVQRPRASVETARAACQTNSCSAKAQKSDSHQIYGQLQDLSTDQMDLFIRSNMTREEVHPSYLRVSYVLLMDIFAQAFCLKSPNQFLLCQHNRPDIKGGKQLTENNCHWSHHMLSQSISCWRLSIRTVLPICDDCIKDGKVTVTQRPYGKNTSQKKWGLYQKALHWTRRFLIISHGFKSTR